MNQRPFRVLIPFSTSGFLYGMERAVIEIFELLRPEVEPVFVVARNKGGPDDAVTRELKCRGMTVEQFSDTDHWPRFEMPKSAGHLLAMLRVFRIGNGDISRHAAGCDALYIPGAMHGAFAFTTILRYRARRKRVVHQFHEFDLRRSPQVELINRVVTDHVHATQYGLRAVSELHPAILNRRNHIIPLRVELAACGDSLEMLDAFADRLNIVFAGQLCVTKGVDLLLEAFQSLSSRYPQARLHLIGSLQGNGSEEIEQRLQAVSGNVRVWGFREDVPAFFRHAYLVVQSTPPSRYRESFGRTAAEAALCGAPVVCFASGALPDIVADGITGTVCAEESAQCLAAAMAAYLEDPALRDRHAAIAPVRMAEMFSAALIKQAWLRCFGVAP